MQLIYAKETKCLCGELLAYIYGKDYWCCASVLLGNANRSIKHTERIPFSLVKVE